MGKFARSWELMKASAGVLRSDKSLLVFPLLSGICSLVVMASFLIPVAAMTIEYSRAPWSSRTFTNWATVERF